MRVTTLGRASHLWPNEESRPELLKLMPLVQKDDDEDDGTPDGVVSSDQIAKYVAVYRAMQRNHSVTVEKAAASQGLTVPAFRDLERRIEKNDLARDQARRALAAPTGTATPKARP